LRLFLAGQPSGEPGAEESGRNQGQRGLGETMSVYDLRPFKTP
jgi:hypothetical protein